jgi:diguanylate cyclase (GGDEF)-like protein/PAS domain S-box-containing protein
LRRKAGGTIRIVRTKGGWHTALLLAALTSPLAIAQTRAAEAPGKAVRIAAATTAAETGVIDALAHNFRRLYPHVSVQISEVGAVAALELGRRGEVDVVISHDPAGEKVFVSEGYGRLRTEIMRDEFALFGPPAGIEHIADRSLLDALRRLAAEEQPFLAPSPRSGTAKKVAELWELAGVTPGWIGYEITGASAAATLQQAAQFGAYTITNMGTYLANRGRLRGAIVPLYRDHPALHNTYSAIVVDFARVPAVNQAAAQAFFDYLVSDAGQKTIAEFGQSKYGTTLFLPVAHLDTGLQARRASAALEQKQDMIRYLVLLAVVLTIVSCAALAFALHARRLEKARRVSEERYMLAVTGTRDGIWDWNIDTGETLYSGRWKEMVGYTGYDDELENTIRTWHDRIHVEDREQVLARLDKYLSGRSDFFSAEHRVRTKSGEYLWVQMRGKALWDTAGRAVRMAGSMTDISDRKKQEAALVHQALHDALTGLPNRALLHERLQQAVVVARHEGKPLTVLMLDLDNFKEVNDTLGHPSGDLVLQQVAARLHAARPDTDTVARFGADKFTLILPDTDAERAKQAVHEMAKTFEPAFVLPEQDLTVRASIGIAVYPEHGYDDVTLIQRAEVALFRAKRGNGGFALYDLDLDQHSQHYVAFDAELRQAAERNELVLHYQPMMSLRTGYFSAMEALVRWRHPKHGLIGPEAFIPRAEDLGLIKIPTLWVLEEALRQCAAWHADGHHLSVAVNLSASTLHDPQLPHHVGRLLEKSGIAPHYLELELTESAIMTDPARAKEILARLQGMGVQLVIDDFGTGYSSLSYLKELPADKVKIDKSFVIDMIQDDGDAAIVRATIFLAHNLGLKVIAEGVENEEVLKALAMQGCDIAQGFHIGRPLSADDLGEWLLRMAQDTDHPGLISDRRTVKS